MRPTRSLGQVAAVLLGISTVTAAWPGYLPPIDSLVARQNDDSDAEQPEATTTANDEETGTITRAPANTGNLNTAADEDGSQIATTATGTSGGSKGNSTKKEIFDARLPAGGVSMIEPAITTLALFKVGDFVTFKWNYTSVLADPTAVDVLAVDNEARQTHTLTANMSYDNPAAYTWDTDKYQSENAATAPLRVAEYTLWIYDSDEGPTARPEAGYLGVANTFQFGLYTPMPYESLDTWVCSICNAAPPGLVVGAAGLAVTAAFGAGVMLVL